MKYTSRKTCRGCNSKDVYRFLFLGKMPLAGGFLKKKDIDKEVKLPLDIYYCQNCHLVQILDIVDPDLLFKKYFYVSSVIPALVEHFKEYARFLKSSYLKSKKSKLLEFGANDGVLLQNFIKNKSITAIGIEPSNNVSRLAEKKGLRIVKDFFNRKSARELAKKYGLFDVITGSNVFAHVDDIHEIVKAAKIALKSEGVFIVEVHYLLDLLKDFQYDTIYHEHLTYYSILSLNNIFKLEGMKIVDVKHLPMHGGAIRVIVALQNSSHAVSKNVNIFISNEIRHGLNKFSTYKKFEKRVIRHKSSLRKFLKKIKKCNNSIVGYGAPGRGTILLNYCKIDPKIIDYIIDVSPLRVGHLMPGVHIPIYNIEKARKNPPDFFFVLAWNYTESILKQEKELKKKGVQFIVPFPKIRII